MADLKNIQSGLEQYRADQGFYPPAINFATDATLTNATGQTGVTVSKTYLKELPHDTPLDYTYAALTNDYCLYAAVENSAYFKDLSTCANITNYTLEVSRP